MTEEFLFSMFPSILTLNFYLVLGLFLTFQARMGYSWGWGTAEKLFWGLFLQLNNYIFPSVLTFDFDLFLG